ncbi:hypothetical protein AQUCO_01300431v1 [Aquilegia coerulea]|uniref:Response regulatory domain-containing protein n=1 Tax=Aquilegia coerulea TaxID=218851 RepID=A0A2G5E1P5_AQUCA|nr:hypothetical protein AQUCO_01300431v1 [Aquilegia coerulea]
MASAGNANGGKGKDIMSRIKFTSNKHFPNGFRILVVDGCPMYRKVVKAYCNLCDYKATIVNTTTDAISKLHETQGGYDLVLSEVYMTGVDGFKLLDTVRREFKIPVILMSPDGRDQTIARGLQAGARFYLTKPFGFGEIQQIWQHSVVCRRNVNSHSNLSSGKMESNENLGEGGFEVNSGEDDGNNIWTTELYLEFLNAIQVISLFTKPEPGNIYECMRNKGITTVSRENVANLFQVCCMYVYICL